MSDLKPDGFNFQLQHYSHKFSETFFPQSQWDLGSPVTQGLSAVQCEWELPGIAAVKDVFSNASPRLTLQGEAHEQKYRNVKLLPKCHNALNAHTQVSLSILPFVQTCFQWYFQKSSDAIDRRAPLGAYMPRLCLLKTFILWPLQSCHLHQRNIKRYIRYVTFKGGILKSMPKPL